MNRRIALYVLIVLTVLAFADGRYGWVRRLAPVENIIRLEGFTRTERPSLMPSGESRGFIKADLVPGDLLKVNNRLGDMELVGVTGTTEIELEYTITTYGGDRMAAADYLRQVEIAAQPSPDGLEIDLLDLGALPSGVSQVRVDIRGTVPTTAKVDINNAMGEVVVSDIAGPSCIRNRHENTRVRNVAGDLEVQTPYSDLEVAGIAGDLTAKGKFSLLDIKDIGGNTTIESNFGQVNLEGVVGTAAVKIKYGGVSVCNIGENLDMGGSFSNLTGYGIAGDVVATSTYGGISLKRLGGNVTVDAKYANVDLVLGPTDYRLALEVKDGDLVLKGGLAHYQPQFRADKKILDEVVGHGSHVIRAKVSRGNIVVNAEPL